MLGHKLCQVLGARFEAFATFRSSPPTVEGVYDRVRVLENVDVRDLSSIERVFQTARPDVVVNAVGIVKQLREAKIPSRSIEINALLPHLIDELCRLTGCRLIHLSTDCVFSGTKGNYAETDPPDPTDLYGRTKLLGEVVESPVAVTLRTSIIGREIGTRHGLVEWFLGEAGGQVHGYAGVIFSGLTTSALSELIADLIQDQPGLTGLWHVASEPISKYQLLLWLDRAFSTATEIVRDMSVRSDRSLDSRRFWAATRLSRPPWAAMIEQLRADTTPYTRAQVPTNVVKSDA
jgi:dTDP-4-dehydrorhamnose reductase